MSVTIAPDFENLLPAHSPEEKAQLEINLLRDPDSFPPVALWANHKNTILDGHNQYRLRIKHRLKITYSKHEFPDRMTALRWALEQQLGRRNLTASQMAMLVAKFPPGKPGPKSSGPIGGELSRTAGAKSAGVSDRSVHRAAKVLESGAKAVIAAVESGEVNVSDAAAVADLPKAEQTTALKKVRAGKSKTLRDATDFDPVKLDKQKQRSAGKETRPVGARKEGIRGLGILVRAFDTLHLADQADPCIRVFNKLLKES